MEWEREISPVGKSIAWSCGWAEHIKAEKPEEEDEGGRPQQHRCQAPPEVYLDGGGGEQLCLKLKLAGAATAI